MPIEGGWGPQQQLALTSQQQSHGGLRALRGSLHASDQQQQQQQAGWQHCTATQLPALHAGLLQLPCWRRFSTSACLRGGKRHGWHEPQLHQPSKGVAGAEAAHALRAAAAASTSLGAAGSHQQQRQSGADAGCGASSSSSRSRRAAAKQPSLAARLRGLAAPLQDAYALALTAMRSGLTAVRSGLAEAPWQLGVAATLFVTGSVSGALRVCHP